MAVTTAVTRVAANTAVALQDITVTDFGTPKAAMFFITTAITDDTAAAHANHGIGATDGTNQFVIAGTSEDGVATSDTNERVDDTTCIALLEPGTTSRDGEAVFSAWITDGVRINWTNLPAAGYLLTVVLFGGDDLTVHVGSTQVSDVADAVTTVNTVGFEAHLTIATMVNGENLASPTGANSEYSFGAIHNDTAGTITQRSYRLTDTNNQAAALASNYISDLYGLNHGAGGGIAWGCEFSNFTASGFDMTERLNGGDNTEIFYLCLQGASPDDFKVGTYSTPTSTGVANETSVGFEPQLVMLGMTLIETMNSAVDSGIEAGTQGVAAFTASAEFANSTSIEDGAATMNNQSLSDNTAVNIPDNDGTTGIIAAFDAMTSQGFDLDYSAVKGSARQFWYAAIKAEPSAAVGDTFNEHPWTVPTLWTVPYWKHR